MLRVPFEDENTHVVIRQCAERKQRYAAVDDAVQFVRKVAASFFLCYGEQEEGMKQNVKIVCAADERRKLAAA